MWFRPAQIATIAEGGESVSRRSVNVTLSVESVPATQVLQFKTLEQAASSGAAAAGGSSTPVTGFGGDSITSASGYRIHQFTSNGTQPFTIR